MLSVVVSTLRRQSGRAFALLFGILVAATSFTVLSGTAQTGRLATVGAVRSNFRAAYDILVRPRGSTTGLEASRGLVRPNYLSGLFGGITVAQWRRVLGIRGVSVAAPIAMGGYVLPRVETLTDLSPVLGPDSTQLVRVAKTWVSDRGRSRAVDAPDYVYVTDGRISAQEDRLGVHEAIERNGVLAQVCADDVSNIPADGAFAATARVGLGCWSRVNGSGGAGTLGLPKSGVGDFVYFPFPMLIAAIDPQQEARLDGLDAAVTNGRYLTGHDTTRQESQVGVPALSVPVLTPTTTTLDQQLQLQVQQLPASAAAAVPGHPLSYANAYRRFQSVPGRTRGTITITAADAYRQLLGLFARTSNNAAQLQLDQYWTPGPASYTTRADGTLAVRRVRAVESVWKSPTFMYEAVSMTAAGQAFRILTAHPFDRDPDSGAPAVYPSFRPVGHYDPAKLAGFSALSRVPLETFTAPQATGADRASRAALGGRSLAPDGNPAGYLQEPPTLLTTFAGLAGFQSLFTDPTDRKAAARAAAPISSIRVRVAGSAGPDAVGRERVRLIAQQITRSTGLDVDITAGSSPAPTIVALPAGPHGRPALRLRENWVRKGVAVVILQAVDRKSLLLFALILLVCALFVGNAAAAAVRVRRTELGTLAALGWPPWRLFILVVTELASIGLVAGAAGSLLALPLTAGFGLHASPARAALAVPAAVVLAALAGLWPAINAARSNPAAAMRPAVRAAHRARPVRSISGLARSNLRRTPGRTLLGATAVAVGAAAVVLLLAITLGFNGAVVGTLLGDAITVQARGVDYAAVTVMAALAVLAVADLFYLRVRERAAELAVLLATGWTNTDLTRLLVTEGAGIGLLGGLLGAGGGLLLADQLTGDIPAIAVTAAGAVLAAAVVLCGAAAVVPARLFARRPLTRLLSEE